MPAIRQQIVMNFDFRFLVAKTGNHALAETARSFHELATGKKKFEILGVLFRLELGHEFIGELQLDIITIELCQGYQRARLGLERVVEALQLPVTDHQSNQQVTQRQDHRNPDYGRPGNSPLDRVQCPLPSVNVVSKTALRLDGLLPAGFAHFLTQAADMHLYRIFRGVGIAVVDMRM